MAPIAQYANVLTSSEFEQAVNLTRYSNKWSFHQNSNVDDSGFTFWYLELSDCDFFTRVVADRIRSLTNTDFEVDRVYANGQTHGLCGNLHRDRQLHEDGEYRTFLIYLHPEWELAWGGNTVIYDEVNGTELSVPPKPNHAVFFDSKMLHVGMEPSRHCKQLRTTVAFKVTLK